MMAEVAQIKLKRRQSSINERHYMEDGRLDVSIGVVTFSLPQQNLVDDLLQERLHEIGV